MISLLEKSHVKSEFNCGNELLNNYLKNQAGQDMKRKLSACFVFTESNSTTVQGYYCLSNNSIPLSSFPADLQIKLPKSYTSIPTTLIGRLATGINVQGKGYGKILLLDALKRCHEISKEIGSFAVIVDPIDENAEKFYEKYGFISLPDSKKMMLSMGTLKSLFEN